MEISLSPGRLMGAFNAGVADEAWGDLPMPMLSNPRVRFWFTESGWRAYGLRVAAEARASGHGRPWPTLNADPQTWKACGLRTFVKVSDSGSRMGAAAGTQVRRDAVIVAG